MRVDGAFAYGYLKNELGTHRLVRNSPFDAQNKRHTSFASVNVMPLGDDDLKDIQINPADIKIEVMRSSGAGGQSVNKTESAVRMTHIPTNTIVKCSQERSQLQNRQLALMLLKSKLYQFEESKRLKEREAIHNNLGSNAWGSQIRSYILSPYRMVKDNRVDFNENNVDDVLDGGHALDNLMIRVALQNKII
jgi:peptide chain release factor 2